MDQDGIRRIKGDSVIESVTWGDLAAVDIRTRSGGPFGEDIYWLLQDAAGGGVAVPQGIAPEGFLARMEMLPGFDGQAVIVAMGSTSNNLFRCWDRPSNER
jgi:hypothetical protein